MSHVPTGRGTLDQGPLTAAMTSSYAVPIAILGRTNGGERRAEQRTQHAGRDHALRRRHRAAPPERRPRAWDSMEKVGPVPERAPMGHRPRGLQPGRQRMELL